jgi:tRNA(Ile)-lysidine synthase
MDRQGSLATVRRAVDEFARSHCAADERWCVALSGGTDSLALAAAAAKVRPTVALIVDHGLQPGSADVARTAHDQALGLGCVEAHVLRVDVGTSGGPEAAARAARYAALDAARDGAPVLVAHTLDDQAETVLLGLGRGSGARSIAGMRPYDPPWGRPLLGVRRTVTVGVCDELGLVPWHDPHNGDPRFTRVRLRAEVLPLLEEVLDGGVAEALTRTAAALREDTDALDRLAADTLGTVVSGVGLDATLDAERLCEVPSGLRTRVIRRWLLGGGASDLTDGQIRGVDRLVVDWRGRGGVAVGSSLRNQRLFAERTGGALVLRVEPIS